MAQGAARPRRDTGNTPPAPPSRNALFAPDRQLSIGLSGLFPYSAHDPS